MDELRKSNQELLKKLKIGQSKAWDILHKVADAKNSNENTNHKTFREDFEPPYTFSTPTKTYLDFLDMSANDRYKKISVKENHCPVLPLQDISNISSSINHGRPHKSPTKSNLGFPPDSPVHSPLCSENHREKLHRKLNASYSKLAADLRQIAPHYGTDLAYDISENSCISNKPDSYYNDMKKFRMANSDLCSVKLADQIEKSQDSSIKKSFMSEDTEKVKEVNHQCIQTYTVGLDYRATDSHFGSQCPLCTGADDSKHKGLIRVNIPHSHNVDYKVTPRETDGSVSLSSHCSLGWGNSLPQSKKIIY